MSRVISRLAAVALLLAAVGGVLFGAVLPAAARLQALSDEAATLTLQLSRFQAALAGRAVGPAQVLDVAVIEAESEALAAARLQAALSAIFQRSGAEALSTRIEETSPLDVLVKIPVTVELTADMAGLQRLLYEVETEQPYLFVERLSVRRQRAALSSDEAARVTVRLRVYGLAQLGPSERTARAETASSGR